MTVVRDGYMTEGRRSVGEGRSMTVGSLGDDLGADLGDNLGGDRGESVARTVGSHRVPIGFS